MIAALAALASGMPAQALEPDFNPPEGFLYGQDFQGVHGIPTPWEVALGTWQANGQTYNSTSAASTAITTMFEYQVVDPAGEATPELHAGHYSLRARLRNERAGANTLVGLVYLYSDPATYDEVVFSPTGIASLRRMSGGNLQTVAAATYAGGGQGVWFSVELKRVNDVTSVSVNGVPVFTAATVHQGFAGRVGLATYNTTARFNKVTISVPWGQQAFTENFSDGIADGFRSPTGTFVVSNGVYTNTAVQSTNEVYAPIDIGLQSTMLLGYTLRVRMLNPYGAAGNLVGISFDHNVVDSHAAYDEVVFSPTGVAQLRHVVGRTFNVLKSASHTVGRNVWFEVEFVYRGGDVSVSINGEPVFTREPTPLAQLAPPSALALIAHWSPGKFDDFSFSHDSLTPSLQTFDTSLREGEVRSGTWNTQGGTLNSVAVGIADIVVLEGGQSDYRLKGRLLNQYGASGNLVGLVFSYNSPEDYLEAVFSPTGQAQLNLHIEGTIYRLATGTHTVPRNVWFDAELIRKGTTATVTVNGTPVIQNVQAGQLGAGGLGVVTHWAKGRFDNVSTKHAVP
jgi:hypothetical protein